MIILVFLVLIVDARPYLVQDISTDTRARPAKHGPDAILHGLHECHHVLRTAAILPGLPRWVVEHLEVVQLSAAYTVYLGSIRPDCRPRFAYLYVLILQATVAWMSRS